VAIGVHVHAQPDDLRATLEAVRTHSPDVPLVLLPDGPDAPTRAYLDTLSNLTQLSTSEPRGAAACFNRLAASSDADVVVLLESGSQPAAEWLDYLLAALDADSANGLAGPTTNLSWNEQAVSVSLASGAAATTSAAISAAGYEIRQRFSATTRTLEPLYSLADFCYVVRRAVIDRIGAADEGYGLGPCWEMDFNIRAARAGFRGVWACGAYVHRAPFTQRRRSQEGLRFQASRQRYQDKFCGRRLRGSRGTYRTHCSGDACPNFAPVDVIAIRPAAVVAPPSCGEATTSIDPVADAPLIEMGDALPRVSCIMPTADRREFVTQAIRCFLRQDYPHAELLIVDDGVHPVADCVPPNDRLRYVRLDARHTVGAKRNLACTQASGDLILHWDDDDWYPSSRIRRQVAALLQRRADLCGTSRLMFFDPSTDGAWEYHYDAAGVRWVAGTSMLYRKSFWEQHRFPDVQVGEDAHFVWRGAAGAVLDMQDRTLCVAMVHGKNTSPKDTKGAFWHARSSAEVHDLLGDDVWLYRSASGAGCAAGTGLLVSCIMPTYNRRAFVPIALDLFRRQDYPWREMIVVDDGEDAVEDLVRDVEGVRYFRLRGRRSIGAKRNFGCEQAHGDVIAHWDDDDWYAPDRLRYQVAPIATGQAHITGLDSGYVLDATTGSFWSASRDLHRRMFAGNVHGGTLMFHRQLLSNGIRYPDASLAEDAWLLQMSLLKGSKLRRLSNPGVFVYVRHRLNAWREYAPGRFIDPRGWEQVAAPPSFPDDALTAFRTAVLKVT
jgi:glycosyltransferase involved in cell wall biosynthesis